jgi:hypothetical protein
MSTPSVKKSRVQHDWALIGTFTSGAVLEGAKIKLFLSFTFFHTHTLTRARAHAHPPKHKRVRMMCARPRAPTHMHMLYVQVGEGIKIKSDLTLYDATKEGFTRLQKEARAKAGDAQRETDVDRHYAKLLAAEAKGFLALWTNGLVPFSNQTFEQWQKKILTFHAVADLPADKHLLFCRHSCSCRTYSKERWCKHSMSHCMRLKLFCVPAEMVLQKIGRRVHQKGRPAARKPALEKQPPHGATNGRARKVGRKQKRQPGVVDASTTHSDAGVCR